MIPSVFEVTYANRGMYSIVETDEIFPGPLDTPNDPSRPDMHLGNFRFGWLADKEARLWLLEKIGSQPDDCCKHAAKAAMLSGGSGSGLV
jgi:hypothetical protein